MAVALGLGGGSLTRRLLRSSTNKRAVGAVWCRGLCQGREPNDLELHEGYRGFIPKFNAVRSLLFTQEGDEKFEMYIGANIGGGLLSKMKMLVELEHPLLLKYNFDVESFMTGAKFAFENIAGEVLHSDELKEYIKQQDFDVNLNDDFQTLAKSDEHKEGPVLIDNNDQEKEENIVEEKRTGSDDDISQMPSPSVSHQSKRAYLASVCTESGYQDFVNVLKGEMKMKDNFVITAEALDSYYMSQAAIHVEEDDSLDGLSSNTAWNEYKVMADITVKYVTLCDINMPIDGSAPRQWKMMRVFNWTFSGQINAPTKDMEWRISEVSSGTWD